MFSDGWAGAGEEMSLFLGTNANIQLMVNRNH